MISTKFGQTEDIFISELRHRECNVKITEYISLLFWRSKEIINETYQPINILKHKILRLLSRDITIWKPTKKIFKNTEPNFYLINFIPFFKYFQSCFTFGSSYSVRRILFVLLARERVKYSKVSSENTFLIERGLIQDKCSRLK